MSAWPTTAEDPALRALLQEVRDNETEHGLTLGRRVTEPGFELLPPDGRTAEIFAKYLEVAGSSISDHRRSGFWSGPVGEVRCRRAGGWRR